MLTAANILKLSVKLWLYASDTTFSRQEDGKKYIPTCFPVIYGDMTFNASISEDHSINIKKKENKTV